MSHKEMRPLSLTIGASLLPSFSLVTAVSENRGLAAGQDCHGKLCHPLDEFCSQFSESCMPCSGICDPSTHNYNAAICAKECSAYNNFEPLRAEIHQINNKLNLIQLLVIIVIIVGIIHYALKFVNWLRLQRCMQRLLSRLKSRPQQCNVNGKDLNAITIHNPNAFNRDIERAPSQLNSVTGGLEGSVLNLATPLGTRYPAENSTTPTTVVTEIGYDNKAMAITPIEKSSASAADPF